MEIEPNWNSLQAWKIWASTQLVPLTVGNLYMPDSQVRVTIPHLCLTEEFLEQQHPFCSSSPPRRLQHCLSLPMSPSAKWPDCILWHAHEVHRCCEAYESDVGTTRNPQEDRSVEVGLMEPPLPLSRGALRAVLSFVSVPEMAARSRQLLVLHAFWGLHPAERMRQTGIRSDCGKEVFCGAVRAAATPRNQPFQHGLEQWKRKIFYKMNERLSGSD